MKQQYGAHDGQDVSRAHLAESEDKGVALGQAALDSCRPWVGRVNWWCRKHASSTLENQFQIQWPRT